MPSYSNRPPFRPDVEAQFSLMAELARKGSDALRQVSELNLQLAHQLLLDSFDAARRMSGCSDPQQFASVAANAVQPVFEHLQTYQQQLFGLLTGSQLQLVRSATPALAETSRYARAQAEVMARSNGDASSGPAI